MSISPDNREINGISLNAVRDRRDFSTACPVCSEHSCCEAALSNNVINRSLLDVYIMKVSGGITVDSVYPPERDRQLRETKTVNSRLERYAVWKLLEIAVKNSFSLSLEQLSFKEESGKWSCNELFFSLSHSHGAVAVAVSNGVCGVDIEPMNRFIRRYSDGELLKKIQRKICSQEENISLNSPHELINLWTKKECIYKCFGSEGFFSKKINTSAYDCETRSVFLPEEYVVSYCGALLSCANVYIYDREHLHQADASEP